jgi:hypothetical protein
MVLRANLHKISELYNCLDKKVKTYPSLFRFFILISNYVSNINTKGYREVVVVEMPMSERRWQGNRVDL